MLHPSWRSAVRRLAAKLASPTRPLSRVSLGRSDPRLEERLAPAFLSSRMALSGPTPPASVRVAPVPNLKPPEMPGVAALAPSFAGAVLQAWQVPTDATTAEWMVAVAPGQDPQALFGPGFEYTPTGILPDTYVATAPAAQLVSQIGNQFAAASYYYPLVTINAAPKLIPNDPQFGKQWHLRNTGQTGGLAGADANVTPVWNSVTGSGVTIGIVDDGLEHTHPDLNPNYSAADSFDFNDNDSDPAPAGSDDHGTSVAGVAAARGNNGIGVSGSSMNGTLAGLRLLGAGFGDQTSANALSYRRDAIDIYNNSWGPVDDGTLGPIGPLTLAALQQGATQGRGGLGNIYTWAAGNGLGADDNVNYDAFANSRYVIAVGAVNHNGRQSTYAEPGAAMLVTAYSNSGGAPGITTTTINGGYTDTFGGTSSATPLVSGVIALMLEANPNLGYRDVQHILVRTAKKTDPGDAGWTKNKAGLNINHKYGFGAVNANAAVALAKTWQPVKPEMQIQAPLVTLGKAIPDNTGAAVVSSVTVGQNIKVEHVEVVFDATHTNAANLEVVLTAPSGTRSVLAEAHDPFGTFGDYTKWTFSSVRHWGELSGGKWTLTVRDKVTGSTGTFNNWQMAVYGTEGIPPVISGLETSPGAALENKAVRLTNTLTVSDPNSPNLSSAKVTISGNYQAGEDVLTLPNAGTISGAFDPGTGTLILSGAGTLSQYATALRSVTYLNTSDDPTTAQRTITFQVTDDTGSASNSLSRALSVIPVNDAPTFTGGGDRTVEEDQGPYVFEGWGSNITPGPEAGQGVSIEFVSNSNPGLFAGDPFVTNDGTLTFATAPNAFGEATLKVRARDTGGTANGGVDVSPIHEFKIVVTPINDGPTANDDVYSVREDAPLFVSGPGVLTNDRDPEGNPMTATKLTDPQYGTVTLNPDGSFLYTPVVPNYSGPDSFTYKANESEFSSAPATVTINVAPVNDAPTANDDTAESDGRPRTIQVLANDTDPDGDFLRVASYTAPTLGRVTRSGGTLVYTPNPGAFGTDVFTYTVVDAGGATDKATVTVAVTDGLAPEVRSARLRYGAGTTAAMSFDGLTRTVLPWSNVRAFSFSFNEGVTVDPNALSLTDGSGGNVALNFAYDAATRTATWTAASGALPVGRYSLQLNASLVLDASGNPMAADWAKSFAVLPGDYDGNGLVDDTDLSAIQANFSRPGVPVNRWADVNGSGFVDTADLEAARTNHGRRI